MELPALCVLQRACRAALAWTRASYWQPQVHALHTSHPMHCCLAARRRRWARRGLSTAALPCMPSPPPRPAASSFSRASIPRAYTLSLHGAAQAGRTVVRAADALATDSDAKCTSALPHVVRWAPRLAAHILLALVPRADSTAALQCMQLIAGSLVLGGCNMGVCCVTGADERTADRLLQLCAAHLTSGTAALLGILTPCALGPNARSHLPRAVPAGRQAALRALTEAVDGHGAALVAMSHRHRLAELQGAGVSVAQLLTGGRAAEPVHALGWDVELDDRWSTTPVGERPDA